MASITDKFQKISFIFLPILLIVLFPFLSIAQGANNVQIYNVNSLIQKANIYLSPSAGAFMEGSTFQVPIFIDTKGRSVNTISLHIKFDKNKLNIISPSGNKSIISLWVDAPSYSNSDGTMNLSGVILGGINTKSGLITTITFKAVATGDAEVSFTNESQVLANDGLGTAIHSSFDTGLYTVVPKSPDGVTVFSETHPFSDKWYNNNTPVLSWEKPLGVTDFSYILDDKPFYSG